MNIYEWCEDECNDIATSWAQNQVMWCSIQITSSLGANFLSGINMFKHPYETTKCHKVKTKHTHDKIPEIYYF
jgi:hypothetical protein